LAPVPSWPCSFRPQQYAAPAVVTRDVRVAPGRPQRPKHDAARHGHRRGAAAEAPVPPRIRLRWPYVAWDMTVSPCLHALQVRQGHITRAERMAHNGPAFTTGPVAGPMLHGFTPDPAHSG